MWPQHLEGYVQKLAGRHNNREQDTIDQMTGIASGKAAKPFSHLDLTAGNVPSSGAGTGPGTKLQ